MKVARRKVTFYSHGPGHELFVYEPYQTKMRWILQSQFFKTITQYNQKLKIEFYLNTHKRQ